MTILLLIALAVVLAYIFTCLFVWVLMGAPLYLLERWGKGNDEAHG